MKAKLVLFIIILWNFYPGIVYAQQDIPLSKMPVEVRDSILIDIAKKVVLKHGPGYYRELPPSIAYYKHDIDSLSAYVVTFPYDPAYEIFGGGYSAKVYIYDMSKKAFRVMFGNGIGIRLEYLEEGEEKVIEYKRVKNEPMIIKRVIIEKSEEEKRKYREQQERFIHERDSFVRAKKERYEKMKEKKKEQ